MGHARAYAPRTLHLDADKRGRLRQDERLACRWLGSNFRTIDLPSTFNPLSPAKPWPGAITLTPNVAFFLPWHRDAIQTADIRPAEVAAARSPQFRTLARLPRDSFILALAYPASAWSGC